jgi:hypothetical protein
MNIEDLTIKEARELIAMFGNAKTTTEQDNPFVIGKVYLIRTVTMIQTGRLVRVTPTELVLEDAAWVADTGRFANALVSLNFNEVEPFPDGQVIVGRGAIVDAVQIPKIQREQK